MIVKQNENKTSEETENEETFKIKIMETIKNLKKMKSNLKFFPALLIVGLVILSGCQKDDDSMPEMNEKNIVELAQDAGQFSILIEAAQTAGLADFLSTESSITVFAPTDAAFSTLLNDMGLNSLDDIDPTTLENILKYHVVSGKVYSSHLSTGAVPSLNTDSPDGNAVSLWITTGNSVMVNNAGVTTANVEASNGVIHIIDKVLLPPTVVDIATYADDFSSLVAAVVQANLVETLTGDGPFTVFAPTNDAFASLLAALNISSLDEVAMEDLTAILTYHVVGDNVLSNELTAGQVPTVLGETFDVTLGSEVLLNESIRVTVTDVQGTNGVIHVIDAVLVPEILKSNTIADIAASNSDFSILIDALTRANLTEAVANEDANLTVFAPTNEAFIALLDDLGASSLDDIPLDALTNILLYHVIGSKALSSDLTSGYYPTLASYSDNNISMYIKVDGGVYINKNVMVTDPDIEADNGVIHVVDKVILPPTVVDIALNNDDFSILVQAVVKAGLVETLSGDGPFTVFAPTNNAFEELFATLEISGIADLTAEQLLPILTYHVVSGNVLSTDLTDGTVATLNEGSSITIDLMNGVKVNESEVIAADIQSSNGVVHVINKVLLP